MMTTPASTIIRPIPVPGVPASGGTMSVTCFACQQPIVAHQTSRTWEEGDDRERGFYHEECLRCATCDIGLSGPNLSRAKRHRNRFLCDVHYADVVSTESSDFLQKLREFKGQSLGYAVARRKSSTTLVFPVPPQACQEGSCLRWPHRIGPALGYWVECSAGPPPPDAESPEEPSQPVPPLDEQFRRQGTFELTSFEQETFERFFYGSEHWNYFGNDEDLGPVILSLKQETLNNRDQFRIMVRTASYSIHGLVPASCVFANRYDREDVVKSLGDEIGLNPPLKLGQLPSTPDELLKLDQVFIKSELKVGVVYVREGQNTEEQILDNNESSMLFDEFLQLLGDKVRLKGFDKYKGGLDTVHDLTGTHSVYTLWRGIEVMFHVSTLLPYEQHDPQKLQRKRHIGNDIVCVVFLEADGTDFAPACIKSHFLHTFIAVHSSPTYKSSPTKYEVSVVSRDEVGAYKPYLWQQSVFEKGPMFREWLLTKIVNGERASYSAPKFARMQDRTRSQMLEDIVTNLQNHAETGQMPKPYRRGSWRPIGHMRPSSPLLDSVRDLFEGQDQLCKDFTKAFISNTTLCDVIFNVGSGSDKSKHFAVRAILAVRSRVFQEMLYGISSGMNLPPSPLDVLAKASNPQVIGVNKSSNFLQVPDMNEPPRHKSAPSSPMVMRAFSRLGSSLSARWDRSFRKQDSQSEEDAESIRRWQSAMDCKEKNDGRPSQNSLMVPRLSVCADVQKVDRHKLCQTEFNVIEFDSDTFETLLEYLHTGTCPLTCRNIPGLICSAEHYDLPELLQACFHHARQFLRIEVVCVMLVSLENYYWRYTSASELVNMILQFTESRAAVLFSREDFSDLSESMVQMVMSRELGLPEVAKFEAMLCWARARVKKMNCRDTNLEFRCTMERLTRDLKLYKISPTDLIKVVLPTKAIRNERILETLMYQANSGIYRVQASYLQECRRTLRRQETLAAGTSDSSATPSPAAAAAASARALYRQETVQGVEGAEGLAGPVAAAAAAAAAGIQRRASTVVAAFTRSKDSGSRKRDGS